MKYRLDVTKEEAIGILNTLGQLPTSAGAWPLFMKIQSQLQAQDQIQMEAQGLNLVPPEAAACGVMSSEKAA